MPRSHRHGPSEENMNVRDNRNENEKAHNGGRSRHSSGCSSIQQATLICRLPGHPVMNANSWDISSIFLAVPYCETCCWLSYARHISRLQTQNTTSLLTCPPEKPSWAWLNTPCYGLKTLDVDDGQKKKAARLGSRSQAVSRRCSSCGGQELRTRSACTGTTHNLRYQLLY